MPGRNRRSKSALEGMSGGIFLIGLGVLFLIDDVPFFPWILLVIGLASVPGSIANEGLWAGLQGLIWMGGLAVLFATNLFWPGILILIGLSVVAGSIERPPMLKEKPKRGPGPDDEYLDDEEM
jgi:hypothetical protein